MLCVHINPCSAVAKASSILLEEGSRALLLPRFHSNLTEINDLECIWLTILLEHSDENQKTKSIKRNCKIKLHNQDNDQTIRRTTFLNSLAVVKHFKYTNMNPLVRTGSSYELVKNIQNGCKAHLNRIRRIIRKCIIINPHLRSVLF